MLDRPSLDPLPTGELAALVGGGPPLRATLLKRQNDVRRLERAGDVLFLKTSLNQHHGETATPAWRARLAGERAVAMGLVAAAASGLQVDGRTVVAAALVGVLLARLARG